MIDLMTLKKRFETIDDEPTDDRLVEYLLGESAAERADEVDCCELDRDQAVELWLAENEANLIRLERLADVVFAIGVGGLLAPVESSPIVTGRPLAYRPMMAGLLALAATISLLVVWTPGQNAERLVNDRVAVAWAEMLASSSSATAPGDAIDLWIATAPDELVVDAINDWTIGDETSDESGFASGDDATPHWLLVAVTQMSSESTEDALQNSESGVLDDEEVQ